MPDIRRRLFTRSVLRALRRSPPPTRAVLAVMALVSCVLAAMAPAFAQDTRAHIALSNGLVIEPGVETALPIEIDGGKAVPGQSFVRIRGLPPAARLSDGHAITPGNWAVPLSAVKDLKVTAPVGAAGRSDIVVSLLSIDGDVLAESRSQLTIAPLWLFHSQQAQVPSGQTIAPAQTQQPERQAAVAPPVAEAPAPPAPPKAAEPTPKSVETAQPKVAEPAPAKAAPEPPAAQKQAALQPPLPVPAARPPSQSRPAVEAAVPPPPTVAAPPPRAPSDLERSIQENARRFLGRGTEQLAQGNVREARLFLQRAAELGSAEAALTMAATYDEAEIKRMRLYGPRPDTAEARRWYERAKEMGAADADRLLARLEGVH